MKLKLAKKREILPGPGSYTIDRDKTDTGKFTIPKSLRKDVIKKDNFELAGPGRYAVENPRNWSNLRKEITPVIPNAVRNIDVRKWGYKATE